MLSDKTLRLVADPRRANVEYLARAMGTAEVRRQIEGNGTGSSGSMKNISQKEISSILVPCPPINDQNLILAHLRSVTTRAELAQQRLAKLMATKHGLAEEVLTGRVRGMEQVGGRDEHATDS